MALMTLDVPERINFLLKRYALEERYRTKQKMSREESTIKILRNFFKEYYKEECE